MFFIDETIRQRRSDCPSYKNSPSPTLFARSLKHAAGHISDKVLNIRQVLGSPKHGLQAVWHIDFFIEIVDVRLNGVNAEV